MNRRHLLIALAVVTPIAAFIPAKIAASWRPIKMGVVENKKLRYHLNFTVRASRATVVVGGGSLGWNRFDCDTKARRVMEHETWLQGRSLKLRSDSKGVLQLLVGAAAAPLSYAVPGIFMPGYPPGNGDNTEAQEFSLQTLRVSPSLNRIEMFLSGVYFRWNQTTRRIERVVDIGVKGKLSGVETVGPQNWALARDGESIVLPTTEAISWFSTRSGQRTARLALPLFRGFTGTTNLPQLSVYGNYALYRTQATGSTAQVHLFSTRAARPLWSVPVTNVGASAAFARDEKSVALPQEAQGQWEIRDLATGKILRTLPLVPGTQAAAFSPDNSTLYSLANGVLYRQRAR